MTNYKCLQEEEMCLDMKMSRQQLENILTNLSAPTPTHKPATRHKTCTPTSAPGPKNIHLT